VMFSSRVVARNIVWLVDGYTHVFVPLSVVIVTPPYQQPRKVVSFAVITALAGLAYQSETTKIANDQMLYRNNVLVLRSWSNLVFKHIV